MSNKATNKMPEVVVRSRRENAKLGQALITHRRLRLVRRPKHMFDGSAPFGRCAFEPVISECYREKVKMPS